MTRFALLLLWAVALAAETQWSAPLAGLWRAPDGWLYRVHGFAANFVLSREAGGILSAAFNGQAGILKCGRELRLLDENGRVAKTLEAPEGPAVLGFDEEGQPGVAFFRSTGEWRLLAANPPRPAPPQAGEPLAVAADRAGIRLLALRDDGLWLVWPGGEERLTSVYSSAAVFLPAGAIAYAAGRSLRLRAAAGDEQIFPLAANITALAVMGGDWLAITTEGGAYALRAGPGEARIYPLPLGEAGP